MQKVRGGRVAVKESVFRGWGSVKTEDKMNQDTSS